MSSSAEQLCGVSGRRKHRSVKWSDREHQSSFLSKIIHFFKKFLGFRVIILFLLFIFYLLLQVAQVYVLKTMSCTPGCWIGSCMQQSLHFRGCFWRQLPNSRHRQAIAKQSDFHAFVCSVCHGNSRGFFPWKDSAVTKNLCYELL